VATSGIYTTTLAEDVWQLWVDGAHMTVARFPNTEKVPYAEPAGFLRIELE